MTVPTGGNNGENVTRFSAPSQAGLVTRPEILEFRTNQRQL